MPKVDIGDSTVQFTIERRQAWGWITAALRALWHGSQSINLTAKHCNLITPGSEKGT